MSDIKRIKLGEVRLESQLGVGGYGVVWEAQVTPFSRKFALKLLNPSPFHADPSSLYPRFVREAETLMTLRHQYIVPIYGVGEHEGQPFILMEKFDGFNLNEAEGKGTPSPRSVLGFLKRITSALGYAHEKNIVHRDFKPSNLMTRQGDACVLDFGIAAVLDPEGIRHTKTGGTPVGGGFAAPELMEDPRLLDPRCDIYSLGATWFWLLTGRVPSGRNWEDVLRGTPNLTQDYQTVLLKTLDQIDRRYQTVADLENDISALIQTTTPKATSEESLDLDRILILAAVFEQTHALQEPTSIFRVEQQVPTVLTKFRFNMALKKLFKNEFLMRLERKDDWGNTSNDVIMLTRTGDQWIEDNSQLIQETQESYLSPASTSDDSEIPF